MPYGWLAVFKGACGESCRGALVQVTDNPRAIWIATADHCLQSISSVKVGTSTLPVAATCSVFARKRNSDFMLAIVAVPEDMPLPKIKPVGLGAGTPEEAIVRRGGKVNSIKVRPATQDEIIAFNKGCVGPDCMRCDLRMTILDTTQWRIVDHDSGGPVLSDEKLIGVISTETLDDTGVSSYCRAELPDCGLGEADCWDAAGFDIELSVQAPPSFKAFFGNKGSDQ